MSRMTHKPLTWRSNTVIPQSEYLTISEFADAVRISTRTVWSWIRQGKIDYWKRGSVTRIPKSEVLSARAKQSK